MKYTPQVVTSKDAPILKVVKHPFLPNVTYDFAAYPPEINSLEDRVFPEPKRVSWKIAPPYNKSFKKVLQDREIKMTDYSVGTVEQTWSLASIPRFATKRSVLSWSSTCLNGQWKPRVISADHALSTYYTDNYDLIRAVDSFPSVEYSKSPTPEDVQRTLTDLKAKVIEESYSGFDALTELAELPETLGMLLTLFKAALRPIQGIKALQEKYKRARRRGKTHDEAHSEIASQWMQYRYGIMPLVYSIQDLIKLLDEAFAEFKTDKAFSVLRSEPKQVPSTETHVAIHRAYEYKVSVVGKAKFASQSSRLTDLITTNIFVTAWELIPMSFVIDWFINVGDVIATHTRGFADLAEERKFCYSIRRTLIDRHTLRYKFTDGTFHKFDEVQHEYSWCSPRTVTENLVSIFDNTRLNIGESILYERREESYERVVFQPNTVGLKVEPSLNWQRFLDGYVLSFNQVRKTMKSRR